MASVPNTPLLGDRPFDPRRGLGSSRVIDRRYLYGGVAAAIVICFFALNPFREVGPGSRGVLMTFSSVQPNVLAPGLHLVLPIAQSVVQMNVQVQNFQNKEEAASRDLQTVHTEVAINYHITPDDAAWIYQHVGTLSEVESRVIAPAISNAVKAATAHHDASDLIVQRDKVALEIDALLRIALQSYRIIIDAVNITDFQFSAEYTAAIEAKQVAQQQAQQAAFTLDKVRVDAQQQVLQAQAHATAQVAAAEGQAKANTMVTATLSPSILQQLAIERWNGVLPIYLGAGAPMPFLSTGH
jgi:regulator of protease activity HflC (stomatin/prohibitin superfamily)